MSRIVTVAAALALAAVLVLLSNEIVTALNWNR